MTKNFFMDVIRWVLGTIDYYIYSAISWVTQGIFDLSELRVHIDLVNNFRDKVYALLGILMLFKLTTSFFSYIVNPDKMSDKSKGASKLLTRTITVIILLMVLPSAFNLLYRAQKAFLPMLPRVLLGANSTDGLDKDVEKSSSELAVLLLRSFYSPYKDPNNDYVAVDGTPEIKSVEEFYKTINDSNGEGFLWFGDGYKYEYKILMSTVVGGVVLILLFSITLSVAVRVFKMIILEMIAPVPILSLIDVKDEKAETSGAFNSWLKKLTSTFFDIFISLGVIYLILFFIRELSNDQLFIDYGKAENLKGNPMRLIYLKVFIILGLLKFAKDVPIFIYEIMGLKGDTAISKTIGGVTGAITGGVTGAVGGFVAGKGFRGARTGAIVGAISGRDAGKDGKNVGLLHGFHEGGEAAYKVNMADSNAKWGLLEQQAQKAKISQSRGVAERMNITEKTLSMAKSNMISKKQEATDAEYRYNEIVQETAALKSRIGSASPPTTAEITAQEQKQQRAYDDWQTKSSAAFVTEKNYNTAKEAYKSFGLEESTRNSHYHTAFHKAGEVIKRERKVKEQQRDATHDAISVPLGGKTIEQKRQERINESANQGGFNPNK